MTGDDAAALTDPATPMPCAPLPPAGGSSLVELEAAALSHPGKVRPNNEDHYLVARFDRTFRPLLSTPAPDPGPPPDGEPASALRVAEGRAGCAAGAVASRAAIQA